MPSGFLSVGYLVSVCLFHLHNTFCLNKSRTALPIILISAILLGIMALKLKKQVQVWFPARWNHGSCLSWHGGEPDWWGDSNSLGLGFLPPCHLNLCPLGTINLILLFYFQKAQNNLVGDTYFLPLFLWVIWAITGNISGLLKVFWNVTGKLKWQVVVFLSLCFRCVWIAPLSNHHCWLQQRLDTLKANLKQKSHS